ncbi:hypothetical protein HHL16_13270 [Pseudoflavitalea sp. G-6-1-2]|uniref:TolB family protein n=1 Tax=Pseudoflavitalea sp. G-6-1-2 TaxID=2728841 RepID=UPI00146F7B99|nr:PD40 domain-containing protein [Pseudoflavitalea sp. G-6-1-2]NML21855.1 hypothetical protein [Pseudoflavitalea sp. G-6-1-2]
MSKHLFWIALALMLNACSKGKGDNGGGDGGNPGPGTNPGNGNVQLGTGVVYFDWATEGISKVDLNTGVKARALIYNTRRNGWDISRDNTLLLEVTDHPDDYDAELYTITNIKDNTIVSRFKKNSGYANHTFPTLSYDKTLIVVPPTDDDGIMILDLQGKILLNLISFQGKKLTESVEWMPDNTLLFRLENSLYRTNKEMTAATLVKTFNFASWGNFAVSPDGSKIALNAGNHTWMMNADGNNLTQITESDYIEVMPVFSPDSKRLLIGYDFTRTGDWGRYWKMAIIPADYGKYNVNTNADKRVIPFVPKGETSVQASDGIMLWR